MDHMQTFFFSTTYIRFPRSEKKLQQALLPLSLPRYMLEAWTLHAHFSMLRYYLCDIFPARIDSCFLMREAFNSSVASTLRGRPRCSGKRLKEIDLRVPGHCLVSRMLRMHRLPWNAVLAVHLLSDSARVNRKPQWGEGCKEMDIDVKWLRVYFPLCVSASLFPLHLFAS